MHRWVEEARRRVNDDDRENGAYAGSARIEIPEGCADALSAIIRADALFETLTRENRYANLYPIAKAEKLDTHSPRASWFVEMLVRT